LPVALLTAAVVLGLVRSLLDTYFTSRVVDLPPPPPATWSPLASRVAVVLLDGLRPMEAFNPDYMPQLSARREHAAWGIARSGEITMTVPGVRTLGAGVSSDFLEILHNWTPRSSPVTSLFTVAKAKGLHTIICGDHVWKRVFADIDRHIDTRLDAWRYYSDPVHAPDQEHLDDIRELLAAKTPFDVLVVHLVGPDHASHRHRVTSPEFQQYTRWIDPKLDEMLDGLLAAGATILVTSDHGMSDFGQHGGDEPTARKTPYLLQGPGILPGPGPGLNQADLPATLAALLGLPIPPFGEGRVAHEVLATAPETMLAVLRANLAQADTYLRGYDQQFGNVPRALLGGVPDVVRVASERGLAAALASADQYFAAYHDQRRAVGKSVARTWLWLITILFAAFLVLLPAPRPPLPGALLVCSVAFLLALVSWVLAGAMWPAVLSVLTATLWLAHGQIVQMLRPHGRSLVCLASGLLVVGLLALAHVGFRRQFRADSMLPGVSDSQIRTVGYAVALVAATLFAWWKTRAARAATSAQSTQGVWTSLGIVGLLAVIVPSGKPLLVLSSSLGLGVLWMYRLVRRGEARHSLGLAALLEAEWFLFVVALAWVCLETWFPVIAPLVDQQQGPLGWTLNRLPWLLAPALVRQQWRMVRRPDSELTVATKTVSVLSLSLALPPLLLAHHTTEHSNLLVWLALAAMVFAAASFRSPVAKYPLGAATFALASLFGSASYALLCFVLVGAYWAFVLAPASADEAPDDQPSLAPALAALGAYFVWLAVHRFRDGSFSFSDIEITVAFYGNPTHALGQGVVQVSARFILPMALLLIPLQRTPAGPRVFAGIVAMLLLHTGVLLIGFLATQTQFYTPYRLAGELVHFIALLVAAPLLFLLVAVRPAQPPRTSPAKC
jgi:hypothetical protein